MSVVTIAPNGPAVSFDSPAWLNGKIRATVVIGSNHYRAEGSTEEEAASNLRQHLQELWAYSDANKHIFQ